MPNRGPFPDREADLNQYFQNAVPYVSFAANASRLGISETNLKELGIHFGAWNESFPASQNPDLATKTVVDKKNIAKEGVKAIFRKIFNDIPESALTSQDRNTLNLAAPNPTRGRNPRPTTKPKGSVDTSKHLEHTVHFFDENTPNSRAKPDGVRGCQIWCKIGSPAADPSELSYLATDTASPYVVHFNGADAGKVVYYWLRWENTRGEVGPWSDVIMATVSA